MKKYKLLLTAVLLTLSLSHNVFAANTNTIKISNLSANTIEFSGLIGGYSSNNPLANSGHDAVLLPDPGSSIIRGHIMVYSSQPGKYIDNIVFVYQKINDQWQFNAYDLYHGVTATVDNNRLTIS